MFALVDVNNFYASCEQLWEPKLRNRPVVVLSNNDGCVVARSKEAKAIGVPPRRINEIVKGLRGITVDTALRLGAYFGTDAQSWINLQTQYDTEQARATMVDILQRIAQHGLHPVAEA